MGKYKVLYFQFAARGEKIRLTLSAAGVEFDDERISFENWPSIKPTIPSQQLPALYTPDGKILNESMAICQFLARKHGLYSNDVWEAYFIENMIGVIEDMFSECLKLNFVKDEEAKAAQMKEFKENKAPKGIRQIEARLEEAKGKFLAGTAKPTLADVLFVDVFDFVGRFFPEAFTKVPKLVAHRERVLATLPKLAEYVKNRPQTDF